MAEYKMIIGAIAGFAALIGTIWKLLDKYDKKGDKRAIDGHRLTDLEGKVAENSKTIDNIKTMVVNLDKEQALILAEQKTTNNGIKEVKSLLYMALGNIINEKKPSHERTI